MSIKCDLAILLRCCKQKQYIKGPMQEKGTDFS